VDEEGLWKSPSKFFTLGKTAEACEAFGELERAYPDAVASRLVERIASGKTRAKCK
jgi:TolA-binding protein